MAQVSSSVGLVSGLNTGDIIKQLMALESQPKMLLQTRVNVVAAQKQAFTDLISRLNSLKTISTTLKKPSTFQAATTASSDPNILTATASNGAAIGTYQFQVARTVTTQQAITSGFADTTSAKVGAGTLTIEMGGGDLVSETQLSQLNGGAGVRRGAFRITDHDGRSAVIDITSAVTVDDVLKKINTSLDLNVHASVSGDKIVLTDTTGTVTGKLTVQDLAGGKAAADLGIVGTTATDTLQGSDVDYLSRNTQLSTLNDGRGVRTASSGADFRVSVGGSDFDITLGSATTVGAVLDALNAAAPGVFSATVTPGSNGISLTAAGGAPISVTSLNGNAAADLGIAKTGAGGQIDGSPVIASIDGVLVSSLNGGKGINLGAITLTDRAGANDTVDLSGANTVQDIIRLINDATNTSLHAALNSSGNGIQVTDESNGTGNIVIGDVDPLVGTAAALGIAGSFDTSKPVITGSNLQRQWITDNTLLKDYNGGKGVALGGQIRITDSKGNSRTLNLGVGNFNTLKDVIKGINDLGIGVTASINDHGDGLLLTDTAGGAQVMKVQDVSGTAAADLNIKGSATGTSIDGSFEKTITIAANDTLSDVQNKINSLGFGVSASIVNDGSATAPYRLSLTARNSGYRGRVVLDTGTTGLSSQTLVQAQDAAVFVGDASAPQPLLITSSQNQITNVVQGVTIDIHGVSNAPVTLTVARNADDLVKQINSFADTFNQLVDQMDGLTSYDSDTRQRGLLLGDSTMQEVQTAVYNALQSALPEAGRFRTLGDVGITLVDGAKVSFDEDKFRQAFATDSTAVTRLFSLSTKDGTGKLVQSGLASKIESALNKLTDPVDGVLTRENKTLDLQTQQFKDRMEQLDALLDAKRTRLEYQFAHLESVLAGLQSQQNALSSLTSMSYSSSSSSKKSS